jgi:hypothetical protein
MCRPANCIPCLVYASLFDGFFLDGVTNIGPRTPAFFYYFGFVLGLGGLFGGGGSQVSR